MAANFVAGVYPMLLDETCLFLAADFDKENWQEDVAAVRDTCRELEIPVAVERSRSGNGAHLWVFFEEAIPAILARKLGAYLLTATMERRPDIGLDSYDRFFPNQDTLPKGGLGNLIALPLQKHPGSPDNSVFLDDDLDPWQDPVGLSEQHGLDAPRTGRRHRASGRVPRPSCWRAHGSGRRR